MKSTTKQEAQQRIIGLREVIREHRTNIHVHNKETITEEALDALKHELQQLEEQFPELITKDSPTQRVAGKPLEKFEKIEHTQRMLSLRDAFSFEELEEWEKRNKKLLDEPYEYWCELKIDGIAIALTYKDGSLHHAATRGDGTIGEEVTQNVRIIEDIPLYLNKSTNNQLETTFEVRGEVYLAVKEFERINKERKAIELEEYANPRNTAAGSIRQLDPAIAQARKLQYFAYEIQQQQSLQSQEEIQKTLTELGLTVEKYAKKCSNLKEVWAYIKEWEEKHENLPYQTDGIVIKINSKQQQQQLGVVGKAPRAMIAFKFPAEQTTTVVEDIIIQVGRTGALTPVAQLRPAQVAGSVVSRATLHNKDEIQQKDVRIGDTVIIQKAGDIIPEVVESIKKLRPTTATPFQFPTKCPICHTPVQQEEGETIIRCTNTQCEAKQREQLYYAISRQAFNIEGLGPSTIDQLVDQGIIKNIADLFTLTEEDFQKLDRFAEKSIQNALQSIHSQKTIELPKFLIALGIRHVGTQTARDLALEFRTLESLQEATEEQLTAIDGIGEKAQVAIYQFFNEEKNRQMISQMKEAGVIIKEQQRQRSSLPIKDKMCVLTGTLPTLARAEAKALIEEAGGRVSSSISKKTDYLVAGEKAGSKKTKAEKLGVEIITEEQLKALLQ